MDMKEYIVTCKSRESLQSLYNDMETEGGTLYIPNRAIELVDRREVSRNTHYKLTADEAELLSNDKRVISCTLSPDEIEGLEPVLYGYTNQSPYDIVGDFTKYSTTNVSEQNDRQWGHLHSAGTIAERMKGVWGNNQRTVGKDVNIFNDGRHVDVIIVDGEVGFDSDEWESESVNPGQSRFVQYDWYANHPNVYPGSYGYPPVSGAHDHGMHVAGTVAGKYYGWAKEANIYSLSFQGPHGVLRIFDLIREFHKNKPINPLTGRKNPTITNNSWGFNYTADWNYTDVNSIYFRGQTYNSGNPGPSGWSVSGIHADFGIRYNINGFPVREPSLDIDIEDAIEEGIVVVGAAGNSNHYCVREGHQDYDNYANINGLSSTTYMHRGSSPAHAKGVITVGAIDTTSDHRRANFTNYGERVDVFSPGENILSVGGSGSYAGSFNLKGPITRPGYPAGIDNMLTISGTSMASPQVCGILVCAATGRERFTNDDAIGFIRNFSRDDLMDFNILGGTGTSYYIIIDRDQTTSQDYYLTGTDINGSVNGLDPTITIDPNDTLNITLPPVSGYVYYQVDAGQTSNGYQMTDPNGSQSWNPTINLTVGELLDMELYADMTTHPIYLRDSSGNNLTTGVTGQGANSAFDQIRWDTSGYSAGTYKYQCGAHPGMQGTINLTAATWTHPLYIRDSSGNNIPGVTGQGFANNATQVIWTPGSAYSGQTVKYQCGNHSNMEGSIVINAASNIGQQGGYDDVTCSQGSPNREVFCNNPRPITGYISGFKQSTLNGRRTTDREDNNLNYNRQIYPRVNGLYKQ
jgi:plastocyanin